MSDRHTPLSLVLRYAALIAVSAVMIGPFLWLLSLSVRGGGNIYEMRLIPSVMTLDTYREVWTDYQLAGNFLNSVLVAVLSVVLTVLLAGTAAYPLARHTFRGRQLVFLAILSTMMVPFQVYMVPLVLLCKDIGLSDAAVNLPGPLDGLEGIARRLRAAVAVVLPFSVSAFGVFLLRQHFLGVPRDLEEAARIDGAGEFTIWRVVMMPLAKPAVATLAIFTFVFSWSNFLWPLLILSREETYTLPVRIAQLSGALIRSTNTLAAASVIAIVPVIVFFLIFQRWFIQGATLGAVKG
jgi:putative chitobiose transport system permease protein